MVTFRAPGDIVFRRACLLGYEGIVSKRLGSPYVSGRSRSWLKFKNPAAPAMKRGPSCPSEFPANGLAAELFCSKYPATASGPNQTTIAVAHFYQREQGSGLCPTMTKEPERMTRHQRRLKWETIFLLDYFEKQRRLSPEDARI